jgi:hypothetical protein
MNRSRHIFSFSWELAGEELLATLQHGSELLKSVDVVYETYLLTV